MNALCDVSSAGMNCSRSITSLFGSETSLIEIVWPLGTPPFVTTPVGVDVDERAPSEFRAVTRTRSVRPMSSAVGTYVLAVAPPMSTQLPPTESQRRHWYV